MADQNIKDPNQDPTATNDKSREGMEKKGGESVGQKRDIADIDIDKNSQGPKDDELLKSKVTEQNKKSA